MIPIICSFYTPDYADLAALLRADCDRLGLRYVIQQEPDHGSWAANCQGKASFLLDVLTYTPEPIVWVDADARINVQPEHLEVLPEIADIAAHRLAPHGELLSGTVFVNATLPARSVLGAWAELCEDLANAGEWDQVLLASALARVPAARFVDLPASYCRIFDNEAQMGAEPIIEHFQASRARRQ